MDKINKWLPIIFGCHTRSDRSFYFRGKKFPICSRCTGELIGIIISIMTFKFYSPNLLVNILIMIPMLFDGLLQLLTKYESNNIKRLITGILFGYALYNLFIMSIGYVWKLGYDFGEYINR
ncbi:MAG: DUF2085 domain-containing protein [Erysipelotrichaceae bacterium]|nr:DUF2085 domain-containing protein [Erysipelotrichaceae bacterium]